MDISKRIQIKHSNITEYESSVTSPVNIAVIKYWGKRNSELILPTNSSLSCTLSQDHLNTKTTIRASPKFNTDRLWLNGVEEKISASTRLTNCINKARELRKQLENALEDQEENTSEKPLSKWKIHIASENNFPTAAGLASSASGYAALVQALANLYELPLNQTELSKIARIGSGSACRSMFGGFVAWRAGVDPNGEDSYAECVAPESHWPDLHALILVVSDAKKGTSSTSGMSTTVKTSELFPMRIEKVVPERMKKMEEAIKNRDFNSFAILTMKDSNQFHSVCLDTYPPIFYMNDISRGIVHLVHAFNEQKDSTTGKPLGIRAAYTFDAGPNAVIYAEKQHIRELVRIFMHFFPPATTQPASTYFPDPFGVLQSESDDGINVEKAYKGIVPRFDPGSVRRIIHTCVGEGPRSAPPSVSLLNESGMPKRVKD
ncbi:hypothetical protein BB559_004903 [Furculomyces boomerangus]|uniref:Diphosphomevalonate decarboxylase n=2 Tax=Harpellales TaxID=61421 RepID=A0A2T9YBY2_9FUNG|nr:hypothetical protein BB559_004903 [Furculomyces boomerangus]PWA03273.1 hypothetical protein BB558_000594 [Smittium angustum]